MDAVFVTPFQGHRRVVAFPGTVEQRQQPMVEQVEEVPQSGVAGTRPTGGILCVSLRQDALWPDETENRTPTRAGSLSRRLRRGPDDVISTPEISLGGNASVGITCMRATSPRGSDHPPTGSRSGCMRCNNRIN